jgi:hypothetical protein
MTYLYWQIGVFGIAVLYCIFAFVFSSKAKKN